MRKVGSLSVLPIGYMDRILPIIVQPQFMKLGVVNSTKTYAMHTSQTIIVDMNFAVNALIGFLRGGRMKAEVTPI